MFAGLLEVGFLGATVAFDGEARLRCAKTQYLLGVGRLQCGFAAAEVPADQLYRKAAAQNDSCRLGVAPNVVLGCGSYVPFATGRSAHDHAAADLARDAGISLQCCNANATFVSGPRVTNTKPGLDSIVAMIASAAWSFSGALFGSG